MTRKTKRKLWIGLLIGLPLLISAVGLYRYSTSIERIRETTGRGLPFEQALRQEYLNLAEVELWEFKYNDVRRFLNKAKQAAEGDTPAPDKPSSRVIPSDRINALTVAYEELTDVLGRGAARQLPGRAAKAQALYECWLHEQAQGHKLGEEEDLDACRFGFSTAMSIIKRDLITNAVTLLANLDGTVGAIMVSSLGGAKFIDTAGGTTEIRRAMDPPTDIFVLTEEEIDTRYGESIRALPEPPVRLILHFLQDSNELDAPSLASIPEVLTEIERRPTYDISVVGHTDRAGNSAYNDALAATRARAVRDILVTEGVPTEDIEVTSHSENNPLVPTADGVSEPKNRRVEITVR